MSNVTSALLGQTILAALLFTDAAGNPPATPVAFTTPGTFAVTDPSGAAVNNSVAADGLSTQFTPSADGVYTVEFSGVDTTGASWTATGSITIADGVATTASIVFSVVPPAGTVAPITA